MKKYGKWKMFAVGAVIIVAAMFLFGSCKPSVKVSVSKVKYGRLAPTVSVYGEIKGMIAELSSKLPLTIRNIRVKEGDKVSKGQILVEFDGFEAYGNEFEAVRQLNEKGLASLQQLEQAETAFESAMLVSPFEGTVTLVANRKGETVSPGVNVVTVVQPGSSYAELQIDESDIGDVKPGPDVIFYSDAYPNREFTGKLEKIALSAELRKVAGRVKMDEEDMVFRGRVVLDKGKEMMRVGMSVNADIVTQVKDDVLIIPREAVFSRDGRTYVYRVSNNKAREIVVSLGMKDTENVELLSGLKDGETVIVSIPENLKNNSKVKVSK